MRGYITESTKNYNKIGVAITTTRKIDLRYIIQYQMPLTNTAQAYFNIYGVEIADGGILKAIKQIMLY